MPPLTAAEKQKRYKEKLKQDPVKYEEYKRKKRENYHAKKKLVNDLTPKQKFNARVIWKLRKRDQRQKKRNLNCILDVTPPSSPSIFQDNVNIPLLRDNCNSPISKEQERGRKRVKRNRSKLYKDNLKLKEKIERLAQKCEKYRKRYQRIEKQYKPKKEPKPAEEIKYKELSNAIRQRYKNTRNMRDKILFKSIFENIDGRAKDVITKESLGLKGQLRRIVKNRGNLTALKKTLHDFFVRDDISRATAGKKETITKNNKKVQKRFLLDSMKNLYKVFKQEKPNTKCSYYYFTRNRPFFVLKPSVDGREMCLCKLHVNPVYKAQALKRKRAIDTDDLNVLISATVCNINSQACMYGTCQECDREINHDVSKNIETIKWCEWGRQEELYEKDGIKMKAVKNVKQVKEGMVKDLMEIFNKEFKLLKKHIYNMTIQFKNFRQAVNDLRDDEVVVVADFSENYTCKHYEEIQAHHFGGSRQQVSLHTVVVYVPDKQYKHKVESYCTISASTNHQPAAIWAHLHPILTDIRNNHPEIKTIHYYTDGPFSQYRQKQNFYFCSTKTFDYGFTAMTWSFFEAGHGKGPADGIGGFLKRTADNIVATGRDIVCAEQFYEALKDQSKIKLFMISSEAIESITKQLPLKITPLVGTIHVHQIFTSVRGELKYRNLSCFCKRGFCACLQPKTYQPVSSSKSIKKAVTCGTSVDDLVVSDEDPLTNFKNSEKSPLKEINYRDLTKPRQNKLYDAIYSTPNISDDDQEPSTSGFNLDNKENRAVRCGDFLIVNVPAVKGKIYRYACLVNNLDDDGEICVTFLRCLRNGQQFRLDKTDMSFIDYTDIVQILEEPVAKVKRGQIYYEFSNPIDVFEK